MAERLGSSTPILSCLENDGRLVVTGSGLGPAAEPQWLKHLRAEIHIVRRNLAVNVAVAAAQQRDILRKLVSRGPIRRLQKMVEWQMARHRCTAAPQSAGNSVGDRGAWRSGRRPLGFDRSGRILSMVRRS
jgi:hypothetical protein